MGLTYLIAQPEGLKESSRRSNPDVSGGDLRYPWRLRVGTPQGCQKPLSQSRTVSGCGLIRWPAIRWSDDHRLLSSSPAGCSPVVSKVELLNLWYSPLDLRMANNQYHFVDRWRVEADVREVADILEDALALPRWWG